jgi:hypothetical protein
MEVVELDAVVVAWLAGRGLGLKASPAPGANLFRGAVMPSGNGVPARAVFVLFTGGDPVTPMIGARSGLTDDYLQVRVRYSAGGYRDGQLLAQSVHRALDLAPLPIAGLLRCRASLAAIGENEDGQPEWSINVRIVAHVGL